VAEQHDVAEVFVFDHVQHVLNVDLEIDRWIGQMHPLTESGVGRRDQPMPGALHQRVHFLPRPSRRPGAVADEKGFGSAGVHWDVFRMDIGEGFDCDSTCPSRRVNVGAPATAVIPAWCVAPDPESRNCGSMLRIAAE
jgi:hypothetical protein